MATLIPVSVVLVVILFCSVVQAQSFEEEKKATQNLYESTNRETLVSLLSSCHNTASDYDEVRCRRVEYVKRVNDLVTKLRTPPPRAVIDGIKVREVNEGYQTLFQNYVLKGIPFKGMIPGNATFNAEMSSALSVCKEHESFRNIFDFPISKCVNREELFTAVPIPSVCYNNFNNRLQMGYTENDLNSGSGFENLISHWPSLITIPKQLDVALAQATPRSCPANMHMLLWAPSSPITVRLFRRDFAAHILTPSVGEVLHNIQYHAPSEDITKSAYTDVNLDTYNNDYLFIPHNYVVSVAQRDDHAQAATVLQLCFFDASNINFVREDLALAMLLKDSQALRVESLLQPSSAKRIDFNMSRKVPSAILTYGNYLKSPVDRESSVEPSDGSGNTEKTKGKSRSRDRSKGGTINFREWQDTVKWNTMIMSLTLPQPNPPNIVQVNRSSLMLQWTSDFFPISLLHKSSASIATGFNLTLCDFSAVETATLNGMISGSSSTNDGDVDGCIVFTLNSQDFSGIASPASVHSRDESMKFLYAIPDLQPDTVYVARLSLFYEDAGGHPSHWTEAVKTPQRSVPSSITGDVIATPDESNPTSVTLEFDHPSSDGGLSILGYHIFARHTQAHSHHTEWVWHLTSSCDDIEDKARRNGKTKLVVSHLLPNTSYEFRVASYNALGNSTLSPISKSIFTGSTKGNFVPEIFGVKHDRRIGSSALSSTESTHPVHWVTIDDDAQTLTIFRDDGQLLKFDVWDCHWSPRLFRVTAEVAWSIPPLADLNILFPNAEDRRRLDHSHGKILVTRRGSVPISVKAHNLQKAGAIAVVILDDERGLCEEFDQKCVAGSDKSNGERFAEHDHPSAWSKLKIPVLLLKSSDTTSFLSSTGLPTFEEISNSGIRSDL